MKFWSFKWFPDEKYYKFNLYSQANLRFRPVNSAYKGLNSLRYYAAVRWNSLPLALKNTRLLPEFNRNSF